MKAKFIFVPMSKSVLYLGDTALRGDGSYLAGVMSYYHINFHYLASDQPCSQSLLNNDYASIIISDYPSHNFSTSQLNSIEQLVSNGMGLLMIGGWASFTGAAMRLSVNGYNLFFFIGILSVISIAHSAQSAIRALGTV